MFIRIFRVILIFFSLLFVTSDASAVTVLQFSSQQAAYDACFANKGRSCTVSGPYSGWFYYIGNQVQFGFKQDGGCNPGQAGDSGGQCKDDSDGDGEPDEEDPHPNDPDCSTTSYDQFKCPGPGSSSTSGSSSGSTSSGSSSDGSTSTGSTSSSGSSSGSSTSGSTTTSSSGSSTSTTSTTSTSSTGSSGGGGSSGSSSGSSSGNVSGSSSGDGDGSSSGDGDGSSSGDGGGSTSGDGDGTTSTSTGSSSSGSTSSSGSSSGSSTSGSSSGDVSSTGTSSTSGGSSGGQNSSGNGGSSGSGTTSTSGSGSGSGSSSSGSSSSSSSSSSSGSSSGDDYNGPVYSCPGGVTPDASGRCPPDEECFGDSCPIPNICQDGWPPLNGSCDRNPPKICPGSGVPVWDLATCPTDPNSSTSSSSSSSSSGSTSTSGSSTSSSSSTSSGSTSGVPPTSSTSSGSTSSSGACPGDADCDGDPDGTDPFPNDADCSNSRFHQFKCPGSAGSSSGGNSSGGTSGSGVGGESCDAQPECGDGDPVMCGIQLQTWKTRCQGEGAKGGECNEEAPPECVGGTVQCEMLIQQHTLICGEEVELSDFEKAFKAQEVDDDEDLEENFLGKQRLKEADQDMNQIFNGLVPATLGGRALNDQCFPVSPISYKGASINIDVTHVCTLLEVISMLLYLAAYITAFHILFRALTEG